MTSGTRTGIAWLVTVAAIGVAAAEDTARPAAAAEHRSFADVEHWARVFDDPKRREWQKPVEVLDLLGIAPGEVVADIGAGTGYFTGLLSIAVGESGKVYAVDVEQAMLDHILTRDDIHPELVQPLLAAPDDPRLPAGGVDLALVVNTWHHIQDRPSYVRKLATALGSSGRLVIIDYHEGELPVGPPPGQKLSRESVVAELETAKWTLGSESVLLPYQYFLTFYPPRKR